MDPSKLGVPLAAFVNLVPPVVAAKTQLAYVAILLFVKPEGDVDCKFLVTSTQCVVHASQPKIDKDKKTYNTRTHEEKKSILQLVEYLQKSGKFGVEKAVRQMNEIHPALKTVSERSIRDWRKAREDALNDDGLPKPQRGRPKAVPEFVRALIKEKVCLQLLGMILACLRKLLLPCPYG